MDVLLIWYAVCLIGVLLSIHDQKTKIPPRNYFKEWIAQIIAATEPQNDHLYDLEKSKPMELTDARTAKKR
jgi:hypothetical protein